MMKSALFAAAATFSSLALPGTAVSAHDVPSGPVVGADGTMLTVSAQGQSFSKPDLGVFTAGVTGSGKTAATALAANSAKMNQVIAALKEAGIAGKDIQTSNLSLSPVYADMSGQRAIDPLEQQAPPIIGYQVHNMVTVRQRDLARFGKVIDSLVSAGANQVNGPSFQMEDQDAALDEARTDAMKKARARAELYAGAAGLRVRRVLTITEGGGYYAPPPIVYARAEMAAPAATPPVAEGEVQLNAGVTVTFELAP